MREVIHTQSPQRNQAVVSKHSGHSQPGSDITVLSHRLASHSDAQGFNVSAMWKHPHWLQTS